MKEEFLLDSFSATGNDLAELEELQAEMKKSTSFDRCRSKDLTLLSYKESDDEKLYFYSLNPALMFHETTGNLNTHIASLRKQGVLKRGDFAPLIEEMENRTKLMAYDGLKMFFTSSNIMSTMDRFGISGQFLTEPNVIRDAAIANRFKGDYDCVLVIKEAGSVRKVFSILSGKYTAVDQHVLLDVINLIEKTGLMGKTVCLRWDVTHFLTSIYVEFPEKAKEIRAMYPKLKDDLIPGLWMATSDTGDCSIKIRGTWRKGNAVTLHNEVKRKHIGEINIANILDEVEKTIFSEYTKLPSALCDLMCTDVTDPAWDLSTASGRAANTGRVRDVIKSVFKQLDFVKVVGKKTEKALYQEFCDELDMTIAYTAYDIAVAIMGLPERTSGKIVAEDFQKACGKAPYVNYDAKKTASVILMA